MLAPLEPTAVRRPALVREPSTGWVPLRLPEIWTYRELLYFLIWRDVKVRYTQTALGAAWALIQPFMTMVVFSIFFGYLAKVPSDGLPYPLFSYAALVPWTFFANGLAQSSNSLVGSAHLITKVYFPRLIVPVAAVLGGVIDLALSILLLLAMLSYYGRPPGWNILWIPLFLVLALLTALGASLWLSALNVEYRDVRFAVPFLCQLWLFATPIAYPSSMLREPWHTVYGLNPMVGVVEGFRWAVLGTPGVPGRTIVVSAVTAVALLAGGAFYFRRMERTFADVV